MEIKVKEKVNFSELIKYIYDNNISNSITNIQTVLDKEIEKSYTEYTKTGSETYYTKWLTLVGFKEMVKEYLGKGVN